ncbi:MAG: Bcr/CflA family drug resistance efflux transporter [Betaproteobacteria bacterium HGW-Betaproteobacteria-3]|jgi:DHA1 family bicyclomycin/chloramphenicol resistance-like MFS transporter|nr:MAG: Bcr/CflA family drug resistance efflux transporter [Betaproteobacteria bacterium HGW-Betaproteobacteria-3]
MPPARVVLLLSLLLGIQPITTDLYLPALPALTQGFGAPMTQAQLTLTALLLAFGVSQLVLGPLSDRFGRRPVLLWGMAAYVVAAVGSAFAPSMLLLIVWRAVQGAAMGAAVMCARAIVRDLYAPSEGARMMSRGLTGLGVIACISAPLGGLLADVFNWHVALLALAVFGAGTLAMIALRFEETLVQRNPRALQPATLARNWWTIVRNPTFVAFSALSSASYGGLFTFLATSSFVFIQVLGLTRTQYGLVMFSMSFVYILGTLLCRRLLPRFGVRRSVAMAAALTLTGGTLMGLLALAGVRGVAAIIGPFYLFMLGHGVHQPCGQSGAVGPFPQAAGAASALNGFLMMLVAFAMGGWLGTRMDGTVLPLANGVWLWSVIIAAVAWTLVQRHGEPAPH